MSDPLAGVAGVVMDMDGVLYLADRPIPGAAEAVERLRRRGLPVIFCTNNSSRTPQQYVDKLAGMGIACEPADVLTSGEVAAALLERRGFAGARAIVIGRDGIRRALAGIGVVIDDDPEVTRADLVVVGWDVGFDFVKLHRASAAARAGAEFVATNADATFPHGDELWPGAGSILAAVETASGRRALVVGKPHAPMMEEAQRRLGVSGTVAMIGDRPDTDLEGAARLGWRTILVLSGVTRSADGVAPAPDAVVGSVAELAT